MELHLIKGSFNKRDTIDLITQMVNVKIKYHEQRISTSDQVEDIEMRENKIKRLQKELYEITQGLKGNEEPIELNGVVNLKTN